MEVEIVELPAMKVAAVEHRGSPSLEHETARRLVAWKIERRLHDPSLHRSYGVHYTDPRTTPPDEHRVDFCLTYDGEILSNPYGVIAKELAGGRYARARDIGSRLNNKAAAFLYEVWLPESTEDLRDGPAIFHYVNVGPNLRAEEMITDVYLPLR
jgi:AraC family transcriptional regulator